MSFNTEVKEEINTLKVWDSKSTLKQKEQIQRVHVRESFLASGFLNDPNKEYHLEITFTEEEKAQEISEILKTNNMNANIIKRQNKYVVYIKEGESISNFLAYIGTASAMLRFEETRVIKDMRNTVNRKVNYETANLSKTINAAIEQIEAIEYIKKHGNYDELDKNLKEIADLRTENPDASIETLGSMLESPISKSGVNHRLQKIIDIARELRQEK